MTIVALGFSYLFSKTGKKKEEYATISEGNGAAYSSKG
jgi:hypothetical protein